MLFLYQQWSWWVGETAIVKVFRVGETGVGEMGTGEMGQIIGETGVGEMGVGEMGVIHLIRVCTVFHSIASFVLITLW